MRRLAKILFWSLIATLFCSGTVMADILPSLSADAVNYHTDISMTYLGMVFGHVGSAIQGMSGEMLGKVIYRFNEGVLIVAGILLSYTTVLTIFRGAYDNLFSSQNRSTALLVGRMAIGFGLLLPIPQSNYNTIQIVLMKIVKESVVLADMTWDNTLDYLQYGGHIFEVPDSTGTGATPEYLAATDKKYLDPVVTQPISSNPSLNPSFTDYSLIQRMFVNEVCMYQSQLTPNSNSESNQDPSQIWNDAENPNLNPFIQVDSNSNRTIIFPSSQNDKKGDVCGKIDVLSYFNALDKNKLVTNSDASNIKNTLLPNLLMQTAESVAPAAKAYVCTQPGAGNSNKTLCLGVGKLPVAVTMAADAFYDGYLNYTTGALRLQEIGQQSSSDNSKKSFITQAKEDGWVMAGAYYYDLSVFTSQAVAAVAPTDYVDKNGVTFPDFIVNSSSPCGNPQTSAQTAVCNSSGFMSKIVAGTSTQIVQYASKISSGAGTAAAANRSHPALLDKSIGMWVSAGGEGLAAALGGGLATLGVASPLSIAQIVIIVNAVVSLINLIVSFSTSSGLGINPIVFLHHIGLQCFNVAGDILLGTLLAALIVSIVTGFCRGQVDLANTPKIWNEWMKPMIIACSGMFLFAGAFNVFFVPCYPYFVFALGVIGWIIMVIEAVVAMPLVALGLTHPEQHELLGKSEQTMMLILSVFLRPSLLVMGLVIAIVLSMVGYTMVIYLFGLLLYSVFQVAYVGSVWGALLEMILVVPMLFLIFCSIVYTMTTKCYQLTTSLTDSVMAWIGVPQQPDQGVERSLRELESSASGGMQKAGSAVQSVSSGLPGPEKPSGSSLEGSK